ncbi:MAG: hypothetical protein HXY35_00695 [Chloroflexi bacterium]|nr:hypothetical protein [Chloroflexota bacterium]
MKSKHIILIGVIIILFAIAGTWSITTTNAEAYKHPKPSPTPEILETGQYRFADDKAGYSFTYYPESLSITIGKDKGEKFNHLSIQFTQIQGAGYQGMVLYVLPNPKNLSTEEFLLSEFTGKWKKQPTPTSLDKSNLGKYFNIDEFTAIKTSAPTFLEIPNAPYFVYIAYGNKIIGTGPIYGLMNASKLTPESEAIFEQVLQTLNLVP